MRIEFSVKDIDSSNILQFSFTATEKDAEKLLDYPVGIIGDLNVVFNNKTPTLYLYSGVPLTTAVQLLMSDSIGTDMHSLIIKGGYKYVKVV